MISFEVNPNLKLEPGKKYLLKYSGEICHVYTKEGQYCYTSGFKAVGIFIGTVTLNISEAPRNIFYIESMAGYAMYSTENVSKYCTDLDDIQNKIEELKTQLKEYEDIINTFKQ